MLAAFSQGGRIGFDAPYQPRGCGLRWFSTAEVCEIVGRFEKIILTGDSLMRHINSALQVLLREDLGRGAMKTWNIDQYWGYVILKPTLVLRP
jgi:hypothetical protein